MRSRWFNLEHATRQRQRDACPYREKVSPPSLAAEVGDQPAKSSITLPCGPGNVIGLPDLRQPVQTAVRQFSSVHVFLRGQRAPRHATTSLPYPVDTIRPQLSKSPAGPRRPVTMMIPGSSGRFAASRAVSHGNRARSVELPRGTASHPSACRRSDHAPGSHLSRSRQVRTIRRT